MHESFYQLAQQVGSAWRFRYTALVVAWIICLLGWIVVGLQKDVFAASARVYIATSSELRDLLEDQIIESNIADHLFVVRQAMLGRVHLERVAHQTGLDADVETEEELTLLIDNLRSQIEITTFAQETRVFGDRPGGNTYTITYRYPDRAKAAEVVAALLDSFLEETRGATLAGSEEASRFLVEKITEYEVRLGEAENRLSDFNRKNYDRLPTMQGGYFTRLQTATDDLQEAERVLRVAHSRLALVERQIAGEAPRVTQTGELDPNSLEGRLQENQVRLDEFLLRYTDNHPDVIATREILGQLRNLQAQQDDELLRSGNLAARTNNPVVQALLISKNEVEEEISTLESNLQDQQSDVARLRGLIDEMPEVEAELARLNRDYEVINGQYQSLLNSRERERLTAGVFQNEQVEFQIIDPPVADLVPVAPKRGVLLVLVLLTACGGAGAIAFLRSQFSPVFNSTDLLREVVGVPVLAAVGGYWSKEDLSRQRRSLAFFSMGVVGLGFMFAGILVFELMGPGIRHLL